MDDPIVSSNAPADECGSEVGTVGTRTPGETVVPSAVPYGEWVGAVNRELHGDYFDGRDFGEIEEEVLVSLSPVPENDATGFRGFPYFVSDPLDHARSVGRLVYALYWAAWAPDATQDSSRTEPQTSTSGDYPGNHPDKPELYEGFDHEELAWAVGVASLGAGDERRLIFEDLFNLNTLSCSVPEELRSLHRRISHVVGRTVEDERVQPR